MNFTGLDMLKIDLANCYGLDKETWIDRLIWAETHKDHLRDLISKAEDKLLFEKAIYAYEDTINGIPSGHNMFLDATASGLQIFAALTGCLDTARQVNMLNTGTREDVYTNMCNNINTLLDDDEKCTRDLVKKPIMTHYYNKLRQNDLTENQEKSFYITLENSCTGAEYAKNLINECWSDTALENTWTLPDGHVARILITEKTTKRVEVDELNHVTFNYRYECNKPSESFTSLAPNIIHSIDGYVVRQMIHRANIAGFELAHIFDAFTCHPNYMTQVMQFYREIMAEICQMDLLSNILSEICGRKIKTKKFSPNLHLHVLNSEYMLS